MNTFVTLFIVTFLVFTAAALLINFCRRRVGRTSHGLTGVCHKSGGSMCSCCSSQLAAKPRPHATTTMNGDTPEDVSSKE